MTKPILYLMLGYPGAGKTTTAKVIHELTGATHLWADKIRREMFGSPTYSHQENLQLYERLNQETADLLAAGNSVIFDTNFNFYKDRQRLREIAAQQGADCYLLWVTTPRELAKDRAVDGAHTQETRILGNMPEKTFDRMSNNLQPPQPNESPIKIDGTKVTKEYIAELLA